MITIRWVDSVLAEIYFKGVFNEIWIELREEFGSVVISRNFFIHFRNFLAVAPVSKYTILFSTNL
jgi:hypothetical protein